MVRQLPKMMPVKESMSLSSHLKPFSSVASQLQFSSLHIAFSAVILHMYIHDMCVYVWNCTRDGYLFFPVSLTHQKTCSNNL